MKPGMAPKPAFIASDSPYRMHSLWVFQETAEATRRCKVELYIKTDDAKEEATFFQATYKEIVKVMDEDYIESKTDEALGSDEYVTIEERTYNCDIYTFDNKTSRGTETRPSTTIKINHSSQKNNVKVDIESIDEAEDTENEAIPDASLPYHTKKKSVACLIYNKNISLA